MSKNQRIYNQRKT